MSNMGHTENPMQPILDDCIITIQCKKLYYDIGAGK